MKIFEGRDEAEELELYITNDGGLYNAHILPYIDRLVELTKAGKYNPRKALKQWEKIAAIGLKKYQKEIGKDFHGTPFSKQDVKQTAKELQDGYQEHIDFEVNENVFGEAERFKRTVKQRLSVRTRQAKTDNEFISKQLFGESAKFEATPKQIKEIKAAIKKHNMKGITWQSVASRPAKIEEFLKAAGKKKDLNESFGEKNQKKIAIDTVKNPDKALLGGPSVKEAKEILMSKFGYTQKQIDKLEK